MPLVSKVNINQLSVLQFQGMIPYQMGVNFLDSQAGKTGFGQPRQVYTPWVDDSHEELPANMAMRPDVPFWTGQKEADHANQVRKFRCISFLSLVKSLILPRSEFFESSYRSCLKVIMID